MAPIEYLDLAVWLQQTGYRINGSLNKTHLQTGQISTDTRSLQPGDLYVPLRGAHFDGHHYLKEAFEAGAALALCESSVFEQQQTQLDHLPLILVENTLRAYQALARFWHRQLGTPVIAVTGSSGKTSTKEILYQILQKQFRVHRTAANLNNEIGVPQTLLALQASHQLCIIEMGMRGPGQIAELCAIAEPDYGIITNIGPVHLSELGSQEAIAAAKWELAHYLADHGGLLVINANNSWLQQLSTDYTGRLLRCGQATQQAEADLILLESHPHLQGQQIRYRYQNQDLYATLDLDGEHQALNLLCCLGVLSACSPLPDRLQISVPRLTGRQEEINLKPDLVLINDSYNANPDAMRAALHVLARRSGQRIAILGQMAELGPDAENFHFELGQFCQTLALDQIVVIGSEASAIAEGFGADRSWFYADKVHAATELPRRLANVKGQILVKASRSAKLEDIVNAFRDYFTSQVA